MKKKGILWLLLFTAATLLSAVGITYAWYAQNASMATLMTIQPPDTITIIPISEADGSEMTELDLDFHENSNDKKDEDGTIHIFRPLSIKSTSPIHRLEVVHTTNLKNLSFKIFPAVKTEEGFQFNPESPLGGGYKNQDTNTALAKEELLENYKSLADVADTHAFPLYWVGVNCAVSGSMQTGWQEVTSVIRPELDPATKEEKDFYFTYYYIEIIWKEDTKETDLFYVMAQNVAQ